MSLKTELKNPTFWAVLSFALGMVIAAWGWDKNESTIEARTHGAVLMIVVGGIMILAGAAGMWAVSNRNKL
jgi:nitrate reductase gamma subunit